MFYYQIKKLRSASRLTQTELAKQLGVTKQCVSNWENGNIQPSIDMLIKISIFFKVSTDYILGLDSKQYLDVSHLTDEQITHLKFIISDISNK